MTKYRNIIMTPFSIAYYEGETDDGCPIYKDIQNRLWIVEKNGDIIEFESID